MKLQLFIPIISFVLMSCTAQLSQKEKMDECINLGKLASQSMDTKVFQGDSESAFQAADDFEARAKELRETKFRDTNLKDTAVQLATLNEKSANAAREFANKISKLNQKPEDSELLAQVKEQVEQLGDIGQQVTALAKNRLNECLNQANSI